MLFGIVFPVKMPCNSAVKLHWDLVRLILLHEEAQGEDPGEQKRLAVRFKSEGWTDEQISYNAALLIDGGYAKGPIMRGTMGQVNRVEIINLTLRGHELARTLESRPLWEKIKEEASNRGISLTFDAVFMLGRVVLRRIVGGDEADGT